MTPEVDTSLLAHTYTDTHTHEPLHFPAKNMSFIYPVLLTKKSDLTHVLVLVWGLTWCL